MQQGPTLRAQQQQHHQIEPHLPTRAHGMLSTMSVYLAVCVHRAGGLEKLHQGKSLKGGRSNRSRLSAPPSWSVSKGKHLVTDTSNVKQLPGDPLLLLPQGSLLWACNVLGSCNFPTQSITHLPAFFFLISIFLTSSYYSQVPSYWRHSKSFLGFWQFDNSPSLCLWGWFGAITPQPAHPSPQHCRQGRGAAQQLPRFWFIAVLLRLFCSMGDICSNQMYTQQRALQLSTP